MTAKRVFVGTVIVLSTLLGAYLAVRLINIIVLLLLAFVFASAIAPLVSRLHRRFSLGLSIGLVYIGLLTVAGILLAVIISPLAVQAAGLIGSAPELLERSQQGIIALQRRFNLPAEILTPNLARNYTQILERAPALAAGVFNVTLGFITGIAGMLLVLVMAFYWLLERRNVEGTWLQLVSPANRPKARDIMVQIEEKAGGYVRGITTLAVIMAVLSYFGLLLLGIQYALVLALIAGLAEFVPLAGPFIAAVPALLIAFAESPGKALAVLILYIVLQQIENNLLVPKVMQHSVGLSPLTTLVAVLAGAALLGIIGALLSVPVASAMKIILQRTVFDHCEEYVTATADSGPTRPPRS